MDKNKLLQFINRILENADEDKAYQVLNQLRALMREQGQPSELIHLVENATNAAPEVTELRKNGILDEKDIAIAYERARERKEREEAASRYGRC